VAALTLTQATPPDPEARIVPPTRGQLEDLEPVDDRFIVPLRLTKEETVRGLFLRTRISDQDSLNPEDSVGRPMPVDFREGEATEDVEVEVEVRGPGRYKVDIGLHIGVGRGTGLLDRYVLYQIVDDDGAGLITGPELRRREREARTNEFHDDLKRNLGQPDVRLLGAHTIDVSQIADEVVPYDGVARLTAPGEGPPREFRPYIMPLVAAPPRSRDPISAKGRLFFEDFDGTVRPLINVTVSVYDHDIGPDEHLGSTVTGFDGTWAMMLEGDDGFLQSGRDIYFEFHLGNARWSVLDKEGYDYIWVSSVLQNVADGSVVDFGDLMGELYPEPAQIFAMLNLGWIHITTVGGQDPGYVEARFGSDVTGFTERLLIEDIFNDGPDMVLHEYAHALMRAAFGGVRVNPGGRHKWEDEDQDPGLAFSEGWASAFALSVCPDGIFNRHEGHEPEGVDEWPACKDQSDLGGKNLENAFHEAARVGERNEMRVAAAINDFLDQLDDDNGAGTNSPGDESLGRNGYGDANSSHMIPLETVYRDAMWGYVHTNFLAFWSMLEGELQGDTADLAADIMRFNWQSQPPLEIESGPVECAVTRVVAERQPGRVTLLSGLRLFRDHALKPTRSGRQLIQSYYRHSPELASILVRNRAAWEAALEIIEHVAPLGHELAADENQREVLRSDELAIPPRVGTAINAVMATIEKYGSPELNHELGMVKDFLYEFEGLTMTEALRQASSLTRAEKGPVMIVIVPFPRGLASQKVDWTQIRRYMEPD